MKKVDPLSEVRERIKSEMVAYRSLPEYLLDIVGVILEKLFNSTIAKKRTTFLPRDASTQENEGFPSYWLTGGVIAALTFSIGWLVSIFMKENIKEQLVLSLWAAGTGALALVVNKVNIRAFLNTFRTSLLDKIRDRNDVEHLGHWLKVNFSLVKPFVFGLVFGPLLAKMLYENWMTNNGADFQLGTFVTILLSCFQAVWVAYYLYPFYVAFPSRLNKYDFDLYTSDPSSSEVVGRFSRLLTFILYVTLGFIVQLTIGLSLLDVLSPQSPTAGLIFSIFVWAPTVILYAASQYHISDMISRAKWKILNEVQEKIETLYSEKKIPDGETLKRLESLMDYHDRIKATPNSALNLRASLNFLNSLLLPVLAFIAANIEDVTTAIKGIIKK